MGKNSSISWTHHTFNGWVGCSKVSAGCTNCYAEREMDQRRHFASWGPGEERVRTSKAYWKKPLAWNREAERSGERCRVFSASLSDWLDHEVPAEWLCDLLTLISMTPSLDWLLLTKRLELWSERLHAAVKVNPGDDYVDCPSDVALGDMVASSWLDGDPPENVWLGTSVEDQRRANERIPLIMSRPANVRFLSCEPLLGPVDLKLPAFAPGGGLHWVIAGGESGPNFRSMDLDWARSLRDQCQEADVAFHFKQYSGAHPKDLGRLLDGRTWDELPKVAVR